MKSDLTLTKTCEMLFYVNKYEGGGGDDASFWGYISVRQI